MYDTKLRNNFLSNICIPVVLDRHVGTFQSSFRVNGRFAGSNSFAKGLRYNIRHVCTVRMYGTYVQYVCTVRMYGTCVRYVCTVRTVLGYMTIFLRVTSLGKKLECVSATTDQIGRIFS